MNFTLPLIKGIQVATANELIEKLELESEKKDALFRGQSDFKFRLLPNFFRSNSFEELVNKYPSCDLLESWISCKSLEQAVFNNIPPYDSPIATLEKIKAFESLKPLFKLYQIIMVYNYHLHKYHEESLGFLITDKKSLTERDALFWTKKENYIWFIESTIPQLLTITTLGGEVIRKAELDDDLTGIDETYPQHYGASTAALDWTYNFKKSIYFSLGKNLLENNGQLSIFVYERLSEELSPIIVMPKSHLINNPRAEAQDGTFTYFTKPCTFYLMNGRFPSIDDYYLGIEKGYLSKTFAIRKYNLSRSKENINYLMDYLDKKNINEASLILNM